MKSTNYRKYNESYFEEILIDMNVESRVALNYRERFLTTKEQIMLVLEMYCKNDYQRHYLKADKSEILHKQFIELFCICIKSDAYKIAT